MNTPPAPEPVTVTGLPMFIWIMDRLSGSNAPLCPGLFERALAEHLNEQEGGR